MVVATPDAQSAVLIRVVLATGKSVPVIKETSAVHLETNTLMYNRPNIRLLGEGDELVWYSDRTGWDHLYLHDAQTGELKNAITSGEWVVFDIHALDEDAREVYFTAGGREASRDPYYRYLYRASLDGGAPYLLTDSDADHMIPADPIPLFTVLYGTEAGEPLVRPDLDLVIDTFSTVGRPPVTVLRSTRDGSVIAELERADASALFDTGLAAPGAASGKGSRWRNRHRYRLLRANPGAARRQPSGHRFRVWRSPGVRGAPQFHGGAPGTISSGTCTAWNRRATCR